jgi:hypothetical protein
MHQHHLPASETTTFQLLAELESYEALVVALVRTWQASPELIVFGEVGQSMERMRTLAGALPSVSAQWIMVVISHAELMHNVWRLSRGEPMDLAAEVDDHLVSVSSMACTCRLLLMQAGPIVH